MVVDTNFGHWFTCLDVCRWCVRRYDYNSYVASLSYCPTITVQEGKDAFYLAFNLRECILW